MHLGSLKTIYLDTWMGKHMRTQVKQERDFHVDNLMMGMFLGGLRLQLT